MEFTPDKLTQKYCSGDCKVLLATRRKYQREHLINKRILKCKICFKTNLNNNALNINA